MINWINEVLSYEFLVDKLLIFTKDMGLDALRWIIIFVGSLIIAFALYKTRVKNFIYTIIAIIGIITSIFIAISFIGMMCSILLFFIVSIKNGCMDLLEMSEIFSGIFSTFLCVTGFVLMVHKQASEY